MLCRVEPGGRPGPRFFSVVVVTVEVEEVVEVESFFDEPVPFVAIEVVVEDEEEEAAPFCWFRRATGKKAREKV